MGRARFAVQPDPADVVCIAGVRGYGKTHFACAFCDPIARLSGWDAVGELHEKLGGEQLDAPTFSERVRAGRYDRGVLRVFVKPPDDWELLDEHFALWCRAVMECGNLCAVVEEVSLVASPSSVPPDFKRLLAVGRHEGVSVVIIGQRFAQFPRLATGMASRLVIFRQSEPTDLGDLAKRLGSAEHAERVRTLLRRHFLDFAPERGAIFRPPLAA